MLNNKRIIAIIPARGGSTRLKNKNISLLSGKPLIQHTIEKVIKSKIFDRIIISTDDEKIAKIAKKFDIEVLKRSKNLSGKYITVSKVISKIYDKISSDCEYFGYFLPTCPIYNIDHIKNGLSFFKKNNCDGVVSVVKYRDPIQLAMSLKKNILKPVFSNLVKNETNSLKFNDYYFDSGAYYFYKTKKYNLDRNFFKGRVYGCELNNKYWVDINNKDDLEFANYLINKDVKNK